MNEENNAPLWALAYFRQIYSGRIETTEAGVEVVQLTEEELCAEHLHLAYSADGRHWTALNGNSPTFMRADGGIIRDSFVQRGPDGWFRLVGTGGPSPRSCFYARSENLMDWQDERQIPLMENHPEVCNVWATEWIYDAVQGNYFVFWSSSNGSEGWDDSRIWACRTADFQTFTAPFVLFDPGYTVIDATLIQKGDQWIMIFKDERFGHQHGEHRFLKVATAAHLEGPYRVVTENITESITEGPAVLEVEPECWLLLYDWCMANDYGASESRDLIHWRPLPKGEIAFPPNARHGSVFRITPAELTALKARFAAE